MNKELIKLGAVKMEANKLEIRFENYITQHNELEQTYYQGDLLSLVNNKSNNVNNKEENIINEEESNDEDNYDVYEIILDKIKESLRVGLSLNEFKEKFNVNKKQASDWLNRAIKDGIVKKLHKPERYKTI